MAKKPLILAVETSAPIGSAAIALGEQILAEVTFSGPMRHSSEIFPAVGDLLQRFGRKPKDIEHIYISIGPGSFTGLRIATALAKTMHLANAVRVVAVDTLDVIAANVINLTSTSDEQRLSADLSGEALAKSEASAKAEASSIEKIATIIDAKRGQFYVAVYQHRTSNGIWKKVLPDSLMTAPQFLDKFAAPDQPVWLLGVGLVHHKEKFKANGIRFLDKSYWNPRAEKVHLLGWKMAQAGQFADPLTLTPLYLRKPDVKIKS